MGNCLVTTLNGESSNDNLPRFEELKVVLTIPSRVIVGLIVNVQVDSYVRVKDTDPVYVSLSSVPTPASKKIDVGQATTFYIYNDTDNAAAFPVFIGSKSQFTYIYPGISGYNSGLRINTEGFKAESPLSLPLFNSLRGKNGDWNTSELIGCAEDLAAFKDVLTVLSPINLNGEEEEASHYAFPQLINLDLRAGVKGDIQILGVCTQLESFGVRSSNCTGTIESFVQTLRANGKVSGSIAMSSFANNSDVTFDGNTANVKGTLEWTETTITQNGITVVA